MKVKYAIVLVLGFTVATSALAQPHDHFRPRNDDTIDAHQDRLTWLMKRGIDSGELTLWEVKKLKKQQRKIANLERHFKRDGKLDYYERNALQSKLEQANRTLFALTHNEYTRDHYRNVEQPSYPTAIHYGDDDKYYQSHEPRKSFVGFTDQWN